ncbi:hypothetical protein GCM10009754_82830 [Amycolatopsis minnesotensis]|uniref:Uncharacterized protein n=2 Tax=Amycolatopsis minnesotensis TaxID=337894 RepID=A0ABP5EA74_9PSEU
MTDMTTGEDPDDERTRTLAVPPLLWPDLVAWLRERGLRVERIPMAEAMGAPVYLTLAEDAPGFTP